MCELKDYQKEFLKQILENCEKLIITEGEHKLLLEETLKINAELLEALEELMLHAVYDHEISDQSIAAFEKAKAAIAKAKGQTNG